MRKKKKRADVEGPSMLFTSNIALRSSSRNRNGIFETCKRFCVVAGVEGVVVVVVFDEWLVIVPLEMIVLVDWGE